VQRRNVWATGRGLFNVVWCYSLFRRILAAAARDGGQPRRLAIPLTLAYVIGFLCQYLAEPAMLLTFLSVVPLAVAQSIVNRMAWVKVVPQEFRNDRFTLANWLWIVFGGLVLLLYVLALAFPATFGVDAVSAD
jgi:hypothetical protein